MGQVESKLAEMGLELPAPPAPVANYVRAVRTGNLVFVSGHGPSRDGELVYRGKLGADLDVATGYQAARLVMLNCLTSLKQEIGELDRITRVVKLLGMVNSSPEFDRQPQVINGCSDLFVEVLGDAGRHTRSAVGMVALPGRIAVEIECTLEVD